MTHSEISSSRCYANPCKNIFRNIYSATLWIFSSFFGNFYCASFLKSCKSQSGLIPLENLRLERWCLPSGHQVLFWEDLLNNSHISELQFMQICHPFLVFISQACSLPSPRSSSPFHTFCLPGFHFTGFDVCCINLDSIPSIRVGWLQLVKCCNLRK